MSGNKLNLVLLNCLQPNREVPEAQEAQQVLEAQEGRLSLGDQADRHQQDQEGQQDLQGPFHQCLYKFIRDNHIVL